MEKFKTLGYIERPAKEKRIVLTDEDLPVLDGADEEFEVFDDRGNITDEAFAHVPHLGDPEDAIDAEIEAALIEKAEKDNKGATTGAEK